MNTPATKPTTLTDKVLAIALVVWLLFFGGFGTITTWLKPSTIAPIASTIGQGAQQLLATAQVAAPSTIDTRAIATPARAAAPAAAGRPLVAPAAAPAAPAARATLAPVATPPAPTPAIPTPAPATALPAVLGYAVPSGAHTDINPDGSFTIDGGQVRYYPDTSGVIVEVRLPGIDATGQVAAPEPTAAPILPTITPLPTRSGPSCRHGCPKP